MLPVSSFAKLNIARKLFLNAGRKSLNYVGRL